MCSSGPTASAPSGAGVGHRGSRQGLLREHAPCSTDDGCDASLLAEDPEFEESHGHSGRPTAPAPSGGRRRARRASATVPSGAGALLDGRRVRCQLAGGRPGDRCAARIPWNAVPIPSGSGHRTPWTTELMPVRRQRLPNLPMTGWVPARWCCLGFVGWLRFARMKVARIHRMTSLGLLRQAWAPTLRKRGSRSSEDVLSAVSTVGCSASGKRPPAWLAGCGAAPWTTCQTPACRTTTSTHRPTGSTPSGGEPRTSTRRGAWRRFADSTLRVCERVLRFHGFRMAVPAGTISDAWRRRTHGRLGGRSPESTDDCSEPACWRTSLGLPGRSSESTDDKLESTENEPNPLRRHWFQLHGCEARYHGRRMGFSWDDYSESTDNGSRSFGDRIRTPRTRSPTPVRRTTTSTPRLNALDPRTRGPRSACWPKISLHGRELQSTELDCSWHHVLDSFGRRALTAVSTKEKRREGFAG
jgi:hypothetical protein